MHFWVQILRQKLINFNIHLFSYFGKFKEDRKKKECLRELLQIWKDPIKNKMNTSSILLAIESSETMTPYLKMKYPEGRHVDWSQFADTCTDLRLYLLNELLKLGHNKYINDPTHNGNTALVFSCALKEPRLVDFLLKNGALITQPYRCSKCSFNYSYDYNRQDLASINALKNSTTNQKSHESWYCKTHCDIALQRFDIVSHCQRLKKEYCKLLSMSNETTASAFFEDKSVVVDQIIEIVQASAETRRKNLFDPIYQATTVSADLVQIISDYLPI